MGICLTGMATLPASLASVWTWSGESLEVWLWENIGFIVLWKSLEFVLEAPEALALKGRVWCRLVADFLGWEEGLGPLEKMDWMGEWTSWLSDGNMLGGETSGEAMLALVGTEFVSIGLRSGEPLLKLSGELGEGLLTGEAEPLGDPIRLKRVEEIVFLAACLARSVLTKLLTRSSKFPLRFGDARSSRGPASVLICVREEPRAGDSLLEEEVGEETELVLWRGETEE